MKTQVTNKLVFQSNAVAELDVTTMHQVIGGVTTFICGDCVVITSRIEKALD
ncbi:hypothetical protein [Flavobacterium sp. WV_118_3]|uniref:hypothetical protein n=1 Tax=Flavobacterium sp. WV_118_3 TaxID=3151764 RepID=UPI00321A9B13